MLLYPERSVLQGKKEKAREKSAGTSGNTRSHCATRQSWCRVGCCVYCAPVVYYMQESETDQLSKPKGCAIVEATVKCNFSSEKTGVLDNEQAYKKMILDTEIADDDEAKSCFKYCLCLGLYWYPRNGVTIEQQAISILIGAASCGHWVPTRIMAGFLTSGLTYTSW